MEICGTKVYINTDLRDAGCFPKGDFHETDDIAVSLVYYDEWYSWSPPHLGLKVYYDSCKLGYFLYKYANEFIKMFFALYL
jgi:hypothetical protein